MILLSYVLILSEVGLLLYHFVIFQLKKTPYIFSAKEVKEIYLSKLENIDREERKLLLTAPFRQKYYQHFSVSPSSICLSMTVSYFYKK